MGFPEVSAPVSPEEQRHLWWNLQETPTGNDAINGRTVENSISSPPLLTAQPPPLPQFGSMNIFDPLSTNVRKDLRDTQQVAPAEDTALIGVVNELCTNHVLGSKIRIQVQNGLIPRETYEQWSLQCMPQCSIIDQWHKHALNVFGVDQRSSSAYASRACWDAIATYKGRQYTNEEMLQLPQEKRINLTPVYDEVNDGDTGVVSQEKRVAYWMDIMHNVDKRSLPEGVYVLADDAFNSYPRRARNMRNQIDAVKRDVRSGKDAMAQLKCMLIRMRCFEKSSTCWVPSMVDWPNGAGFTASTFKTCGGVKHTTITYAHSREEMLEVLRGIINPQFGASTREVGQARNIRTWILQHHYSLASMEERRKQINDIEKSVVEHRHARGLEMLNAGYPTCSPMLNTLIGVDLWQGVFEFLDAPASACFMRVFIGAADRINGRLSPDADIMTQLRGRLPHLHIYSVPGCFPHRMEGSDSHILSNRYLEICIGLVESRPRSIVRAERIAAGYLPPLTPDEIKKADAKLDAGQTTRFVLDERFTKLVADGYDFGYDKHEQNLRVISADMVARNSNRSLRQRRTKNEGWSIRSSTLNCNLKYTTVDTARLFSGQPKLTLQLVHDDTGEVADTNASYGGLVPDKWLMEVNMIPLSTSPKCWCHVSELDKNVATLVRVRPSVLTSSHNGARFRIVVKATGTHRKNGTTITLSTSSQPLTCYSDKRTKSTTVGRAVSKKPKI